MLWALWVQPTITLNKKSSSACYANQDSHTARNIAVLCSQMSGFPEMPYFKMLWGLKAEAFTSWDISSISYLTWQLELEQRSPFRKSFDPFCTVTLKVIQVLGSSEMGSLAGISSSDIQCKFGWCSSQPPEICIGPVHGMLEIREKRLWEEGSRLTSLPLFGNWPVSFVKDRALSGCSSREEFS